MAKPISNIEEAEEYLQDAVEHLKDHGYSCLADYGVIRIKFIDNDTYQVSDKTGVVFT